jgi:hypothetical protein
VGPLNSPVGAGNTASVIRAALSAAALLLAAAPLLGCGAPPRTPGPPGATLILLENAVEGPCELTWADARIDNRPLDRVTITPVGARPAALDRPVLAPGEHTVAISASAMCPGKAGDAQPAVLQVTQPVYMGDKGGQITVSVAKDSSSDSGLKVSFHIAGGHVLSPRADGGEVDCRGRLPVDRAICRTESALARAQKRRDVVLSTCISEKLREMRLLAETAGPRSLDPASDDAALRDVAMETTRRVLSRASEADRCIGEESFAGDGVSAERGGERAVSAFR